ncbi:MAG: metal-dependent hydrolase [Herbaspirillum sp.]|nr:metal-dependent hydrolase [Herbaspirillum sp.]
MKLLRQKRQKPGPEQLALQLDLFASTDVQPGIFKSPGPATAPLPELVPAPPPVAPGWRRLYVDEHMLDYVLQRSKRRSIGFLINDDGLRVTAPKWAAISEIEKAIHEKQRWIFSKLHERRERSARRLQPPMQWRDGATLPYLGQDISLRIRTAQNMGVRYEPDTRELIIGLPEGAGEQQLKDRVQGWLQTQARLLFAERLPIYAEKLSATYHSFALSSATTQWGSCTADGKIRLNWRLMHFALPMIDYVIAHELSHLREMNHGPKFWATVQSIFPEFESAKKALRDSAQETLPVF